MQREYCGCDVLTVLRCQCELDLQLYDFRKHMMWGKHYSFNQSINFWGDLSNKLLPQWPHRVTVVYKTRPGYESRNRCSLSRFLKVTSTGRSFHMQAPATRKAQRPIVGSLTAGTSRSSDEEDGSLCFYLFTCKNRRPYNLYCVGADVKPCSINQFTLKCLHIIVDVSVRARCGLRLYCDAVVQESFAASRLGSVEDWRGLFSHCCQMLHICTLSVFCVCFSVGWQISHQ